MARREAKQFKALYFDLYVSELKKNYPGKNYLGAYGDIKRYLLKRDFTHEQWSGYHSKDKMTDLELFDLVQDLSDALPWFSMCINHFEVTNIGTNYNLVDILIPDALEPIVTSDLAAQ